VRCNTHTREDKKKAIGENACSACADRFFVSCVDPCGMRAQMIVAPENICVLYSRTA